MVPPVAGARPKMGENFRQASKSVTSKGDAGRRPREAVEALVKDSISEVLGGGPAVMAEVVGRVKAAVMAGTESAQWFLQTLLIQVR